MNGPIVTKPRSSHSSILLCSPISFSNLHAGNRISTVRVYRSLRCRARESGSPENKTRALARPGRPLPRFRGAKNRQILQAWCQAIYAAAPTPRGTGDTCPQFYKWLDTEGGTVSRKTANKKLTVLSTDHHESTHAPKLLIVFVEPKKWSERKAILVDRSPGKQ